VLDDLWLNSLAAPADTIRGLTCVRKAPLATFTPSTTPPEPAGTTVAFDLGITNPSSASCPADPFEIFAQVPFGLNTDFFTDLFFLAPGESTHRTVDITSQGGGPFGPIPFQYFVTSEADPALFAVAQATYVVALPTGPFACSGSPPQTPQIFGSPFSPAGVGAIFSFAAAGLTAPAVTPVVGTDGSTQGLQVIANPGTASDPGQSFFGFGSGFFNPPCLDARAFNAVRFTVTGDLGTCTLSASVIMSQDNDVANGPFGTCTAGPGSCFSPFSGPLTTGVSVVHFADMMGGQPVATVDARGLNGVSWTMNVPTDGVSAPCAANFTITDVSFVNDTVPDVNFTFDAGTQGWVPNDFPDTALTNLGAPGAAAAAGTIAPTLTFTPTDGDPSPGALRLAVTFSALDQYVDAITNPPQPGLNLTGQTLHARVRLASGSFPLGGVLFHAGSGPSFSFGSAPFFDPSTFPLGVWVPLDFNLAAVAGVGGFDPSQIVQIGAMFFSGFSNNGSTFQPVGETVFEIDTVTD
jgi:hypothetical protein